MVGIAGSNLGWGGEGDVRHQAARAEEKDIDSLWKLWSVVECWLPAPLAEKTNAPCACMRQFVGCGLACIVLVGEKTVRVWLLVLVATWGGDPSHRLMRGTDHQIKFNSLIRFENRSGYLSVEFDLFGALHDFGLG